jgi:site-specific recombinase XerD
MITGAPLAALLPSWELNLAERDLSSRTLECYLRTGRQLVAYLERNGLPADTEGVDAPHLRAFLAAETARTSAVSAHQHFRNLRVMFKWLAREGERTGPDPMARVDPPKVNKKVKPIIGEDDLTKLLKSAEGTDFISRRDMAILRVLVDCGARVSGVGDILLADVSLPHKTILIRLKGGDEWLVPIGRKAAAALDRYIRIRARHARADSPWLWLGVSGRDRGHFGSAGIQDLVERRSKAVLGRKLTPHAFRRTAAHMMLDAGMQEMDVARVAGWKTTAMVRLYTEDLAADRARLAHARLSPGDRL